MIYNLFLYFTIMTEVSIQDFYRIHNILKQPQLLKINTLPCGKIEKKFVGPEYKVDGIKHCPSVKDSDELIKERDSKWTYKSGDFFVGHLKFKEIYVLDVDWPNDYKPSNEAQEFIDYMKRNYPYKVSTTKKRGLHIYFIATKSLESAMELDYPGYYGARLEDYPYPKMEILRNCFCLEKYDTKICCNKKDMSISKLSKDTMEKTGYKFTTKKVNKKIIEIRKLTKEEADLPKPDWLRILRKNYSKDDDVKEECRIWSKKSTTKYNSDASFDKDWKFVSHKETTSKKEEETYATEIHQDFYEIFKNNYIINIYEGEMDSYIYHEPTTKWISDPKKQFLRAALQSTLIEKYKNDKSIECISKLRKINCSIGAIKDAADMFILRMTTEWKKNIEFDNLNHLFHFENKTLDLKEMKFIDREKNHYSTFTANSIDIDITEEKKKKL